MTIICPQQTSLHRVMHQPAVSNNGQHGGVMTNNQRPPETGALDALDRPGPEALERGIRCLLDTYQETRSRTDRLVLVLYHADPVPSPRLRGAATRSAVPGAACRPDGAAAQYRRPDSATPRRTWYERQTPPRLRLSSCSPRPAAVCRSRRRPTGLVTGSCTSPAAAWCVCRANDCGIDGGTLVRFVPCFRRAVAARIEARAWRSPG